jgi:hypothetical protein
VAQAYQVQARRKKEGKAQLHQAAAEVVEEGTAQ